MTGGRWLGLLDEENAVQHEKTTLAANGGIRFLARLNRLQRATRAKMYDG